jgi:hypothetical protein
VHDLPVDVDGMLLLIPTNRIHYVAGIYTSACHPFGESFRHSGFHYRPAFSPANLSPTKFVNENFKPGVDTSRALAKEFRFQVQGKYFDLSQSPNFRTPNSIAGNESLNQPPDQKA